MAIVSIEYLCETSLILGPSQLDNYNGEWI
jgi:hypothetical protein